MMTGEGFGNEVKENSKGQSNKHTHAPLGVTGDGVSTCLVQQVLMGLNDANEPNMSLVMDITTERAQPEDGFKFASNSPTPINSINTKKLRGEGPKKNKNKDVSERKREHS